MIYNRITGEISSWTDTLETLDDVNTTTSPANLADGALLRYNTSTSVYDRRSTQYYNLIWYGQLATINSTTQRAIFLTGSWTSLTQDTDRSFPMTKFSVGSASTGVLSGFDSTKTYKLELHMSLNCFDITAPTDLSVVLRETSSAGAVMSTARVRATQDAQCPSVHSITILNGYSSYYYGFVVGAGTLTGTTNNVQIAFSAVEL
jgi:hypothetical protein